MRNKKEFIASLMLFLAAMIWGLAYSIQRISASTLGSFSIIFLKGAGGLFLIPVAIMRKYKLNVNVICNGFLIGLTGFLGNLGQQKGLELTSVSKAGFIVALYILFVPIIGIFLGKKPKANVWLAVIIACVGFYFLCMSGEFSVNIGDIFSLMAAFFFAAQIFVIDRYATNGNALLLTIVQNSTIMILSLIFMIFVDKPTIKDFGSSILPIIYTVFVSGIAGQLIQTRFQSEINPTIAALIMSLESVFASIFAFLVLNQTMSTRELIGSALIFIAIIIAKLKSYSYLE